MDLTFHPASEMFPLLSDADLAALASDIKANGLREPITLHPDGSILDGRNRYRACINVEVEPRFVEWDDQGTPEVFVISMNLYRRHLTVGQRSMAGARLANMKSGARTDLEPKTNLSEVSNAEAAQTVNVSKQSVKNAKTVLDSGDDELIHQVETGNMSVSTAAKGVRERDKQVDDSAPKRCKRKRESADASAARGATLRQYGVLARKLYDGLEAITGLPDIETMLKATNKKHDVLTTKVPIAINWLSDFAHALSERNKRNGKQSGEAERVQGKGHEEETQPQDRALDAGDGDQAA
ncbi:MAG TPA: hypothetical protein ENH89_00060 [Aurantimonas coralicida]|uniref:ParB/Sulfiredoxin domain-containing protein n=2 Tax=root TaxID=1 RepID=A0A9C9TF54_9HYPH|nr:hypothetical protein [Aurantimonas coralicida]